MRHIIINGIGALTLAMSWQGAADAQSYPTIAGAVVASGGEFDQDVGDFDILLNAVITADLVAALDDPAADLTVFAPTDAAFIRLAREFGYAGNDEAGAFGAIVDTLTALGSGDPIPVLTDILLYHVSPEAKSLEEVLHTPIVDTLLDGATLMPIWNRLQDNDPDLQDGAFLRFATDIQASNGVVHAINHVLIPVDVDNVDTASLQTIAGIVSASGGTFDDNRGDFDILLNAVITANLVGALDNPADSLTVFAPTDAAFIRTASALGYAGQDESQAFQFIVAALTDLGGGDPVPLLTDILLYHVSPGELSVKGTLETEVVSTLLGDATIHPDPASRRLGDGEPTLRDPLILLKDGNIRASNGFINPISSVLIPVDLSTL
jgi:uncharacterized surface protein with fasciclin (FAS1) repeats